MTRHKRSAGSAAPGGWPPSALPTQPHPLLSLKTRPGGAGKGGGGALAGCGSRGVSPPRPIVWPQGPPLRTAPPRPASNHANSAPKGLRFDDSKQGDPLQTRAGRGGAGGQWCRRSWGVAYRAWRGVAGRGGVADGGREQQAQGGTARGGGGWTTFTEPWAARWAGLASVRQSPISFQVPVTLTLRATSYVGPRWDPTYLLYWRDMHVETAAPHGSHGQGPQDPLGPSGGRGRGGAGREAGRPAVHMQCLHRQKPGSAAEPT